MNQLPKKQLDIYLNNSMYEIERTIKAYFGSTSVSVTNNNLKDMNCNVIIKDLYEIIILLNNFDKLKSKINMLKYIK